MHGHASGHHTPASETTALLALFGGPGAAAGNIVTWDQKVAAVTTGDAPAISGLTDTTNTILKQASGKFKVVATTSGSVSGGINPVTSGKISLQSSIDGGTTWVTKKVVELPAITAGAAATVATALVAEVDLSTTITPVGAKFQLIATPAGALGVYTTLISEGGVVAQELPF